MAWGKLAKRMGKMTESVLSRMSRLTMNSVSQGEFWPWGGVGTKGFKEQTYSGRNLQSRWYCTRARCHRNTDLSVYIVLLLYL